jgi:hypothetical protein
VLPSLLKKDLSCHWIIDDTGFGKVCHERLRPIKRCYSKDEGRPLEVAFQKEASNRPLLLRSQVRGGERVGQVARIDRAWVRTKETSESEPPMTYRETLNVVETGGAFHRRDQSAGCLSIRGWQPVYRRRDFGSGFVVEHENLPIDVKGKRRVAHTTSANTDAIGRDGVTRSSVEAPVMGVERRGHGVLEMKSINVREERRNR